MDWYASHGFHPTFFYEAGWSILLFGLLYLVYWQFGHKLRRGDGALLYFIAYPLGRFWVEYFRPDAWVMGELATAQWIAIISVAASIALLAVRHYGWSAQDNQDESLSRAEQTQPHARSSPIGAGPLKLRFANECRAGNDRTMRRGRRDYLTGFQAQNVVPKLRVCAQNPQSGDHFDKVINYFGVKAPVLGAYGDLLQLPVG